MKTATKAAVLGALVSASALAGVAPAAFASTLSPLQMTISPATVLVAQGQHSYSETVTVQDTGSAPILVHPSVVQLNHGPVPGCATSGSPTWARLSSVSGLPLGSSIRLEPGASLAVKFSLAAPASLTGTQDMAAVFSASPATTVPGQARIGAAVGSRVVLRLQGSAVTKPPVCGTLPAHKAVAAGGSSSPVSVPLVAGLSGLLGLFMLIPVLIRRRRRHVRS